jgi:glycosyltransferase involved in cell wall biosynthesis
MHAAIVYLSGGGLSGGARNTLRALVTELRRDERVRKLDLFVPPPSMHLPEVTPLEPETWPARDRLFRFRSLRRKIRASKPDVVFIPNAAWFDTGGIPTVCMVRNTEAILQPFGDNPWRVGLKNVLRAHVARRACRRSTRIIAVSNFVREILVDRWMLPPEKIGVVYHGVSAPPEEEVRRPDTMFDGDKPFWFSAGSFIPYRGYEDAIRALAVRVGQGHDENLVLAGGLVYSDAYRRRTEALAEELGVASRVRRLGYIRAGRMAWCFRESLGFLMTSRLEACPNLALEALANGAVSISTTHPPMPEIFGTTATQYQAGEIDSLTRAMRHVATMPPSERQAARQAARDRAKEFSWTITADRTIEQLQLAAGT